MEKIPKIPVISELVSKVETWTGQKRKNYVVRKQVETVEVTTYSKPFLVVGPAQFCMEFKSKHRVSCGTACGAL